MDQLLIEKVREHEVIYNHLLPDYRDQRVRQKAWEEVGKALNLPGVKAKERWDNLRRCFCNARHRRRGDPKRMSVWKYERQMAFLIPFIEVRKFQSNLKESQSGSNTLEPYYIGAEAFDIEESPHVKSERESFHSDVDFEHEDRNTPAESNEADFSDIELDFKSPEKRAKTSDPASIQTPSKRKCEDQNTDKCNDAKPVLEILDDTDMFFLSMARMTKNLPKLDQAQIKLALSNAVLSAEIRYQKNNSELLQDPSGENHVFPNSAPSSERNDS